MLKAVIVVFVHGFDNKIRIFHGGKKGKNYSVITFREQLVPFFLTENLKPLDIILKTTYSDRFHEPHLLH
jgi:hypothetical protein